MGILPSRQTAALFDEISSKRGGPAPSPGVERDSPKRTKKPTIVIMPLENLSSEPGQAHITAGITQDIIAALLRHRWLSVINAANMVSAGRFAMVEDGQVVEANANYLLTGTLRKAGDRLRINVQMTATASREYIWLESYDGQLGDIFGVQDEITTRIASHIDIEVGTSERQRVLRQANPRTGAWDCYHLGMTHFLKSTSHDHLESQRLFARSMEIDDQFG